MWLTMADERIALEDLDSDDAQYEVLVHVIDELGLPILLPNMWEAEGDVTTTYCRYLSRNITYKLNCLLAGMGMW